MKYIDRIPKPLLEDFLNGRVIPFVGEGFSKNADIPDGVKMPDWKELGKLAADEISGYTFDGNSIDALSSYEEQYSRPKLVELIMRNTGFGRIAPGKVYESFCRLFTKLFVLLIMIH